MSYQNLTLDEIDYFLGGKEQAPRPTGIGVFEECDGDINAAYLGENFTRGDIEALLLDNYALAESAFETIETFQWRWRGIWNEWFPVLKQNLLSAVDIELSDSTSTRDRRYSEEGSGTSSSESDDKTTTTRDTTGEERFSNTPNQLIQGSFTGLTTLRNTKGTEGVDGSTHGTTSATASSDKSGTDNETTTKSGNVFLKWLSVSKENKNIIYSFFEKFDPCFIRSCGICNYDRGYFYTARKKELI